VKATKKKTTRKNKIIGEWIVLIYLIEIGKGGMDWIWLRIGTC
jgi:hypothetical protein